MKNLHFRPIWGLFLMGLITILASFCSFDTSGAAIGFYGYDNIYYYTTKKYLRKIDFRAVSISVTKRPNDHYPKNKIKQMDYTVDQARQAAYPKGGLEVGKKAYSDKNWAIWKVPPSLLGAAYIKSRYFDHVVNDSQFMKINYNDDIDGIYIAYDADIKEKDRPDWLMQYTPQNKSITISAEEEKIELNLYRLNTTPPKNQDVLIPSNFFGYQKGMPPYKAQDKLEMFILIVKPEGKPNAAVAQKVGVYNFSGCFKDEKTALKKAKEDADAKLKKEKDRNHFSKMLYIDEPQLDELRKSMCTAQGTGNGNGIGSKKQTLASADSTYSNLSEIQINLSQSYADVKIEGKTFKPEIQGTILFRYKLDKNLNLTEIFIERMEIIPDNIGGTNLGFINDISIFLTQPTVARMNDPNPLPTYPAVEYIIPKNSFKSVASLKFDDDRVLFKTDNSEMIKIHVDNTTRTMNFTGKLKTEVPYKEDETMIIDVFVSIVGDFKNFPPKALAGPETTRSVECEDKLNSEPITLDASRSFDVYNNPKNNQLSDVRFQWYKDYRTPLEYPYKKGKQVIIPPSSLGPGIHYFTLVVTDPYGLVDMDVIQVEVKDDTKPEVTAPLDRIRLVFYPETCPVTVPILGEANYKDTCAGGDVVISNDAPSDLLFPEGKTVVTWKAEDGHGNMKTDKQSVHIVQFGDPKIQMIPKIASMISDAVGGIKDSTDTWKDWHKPVLVDFEPLLQVIDQMIEVMETSEMEVRDEIRDQIVEKLTGSAHRLNEVSTKLKDVDASDIPDMLPLLSQVKDQLSEIQDRLHEIEGIVPTISEVPEHKEDIERRPFPPEKERDYPVEASFSDHFDSQMAENWELEEAWRVAEEDGNPVLRGEGHHWARLGLGHNWSDYTFRSRVKVLQGGLHLNFRVSDQGRYFIGIRKGMLYLRKETPWGTFFELAEEHLDLELNTWYNAEIRGQGGHLQVSIDGELKIDFMDAANPLEMGSIAFESLDDSIVQVDDVEVYRSEYQEGSHEIDINH